MPNVPRQKHTPEQWQQLIDAQAASGQSQVAFCAEHGESPRLSRRLMGLSHAALADSVSVS